MPDIFDQIAPEKAQAPPPSGDIFDQISASPTPGPSAKPAFEDAGPGYSASKLAPEPEATAQSRFTKTPIAFGQTYNAPDANSASTLYNDVGNKALSIEANFGSDPVANSRMLRHESIHGMLVESPADYQKIAKDPAVAAAAASIKKRMLAAGYKGDIDRELPAYLGAFSNSKSEWTGGVTPAERNAYVEAYAKALSKQDPQTAAKYRRMLIDSSPGTPASAINLEPDAAPDPETYAPGIPKPPLPYELQKPDQQAKTNLAGGATFQNPRTGRITPRQQPGQEGGPLGMLDMPITGTRKMVEGAEQTAEPGLRAKAGGAAKIIGGGLEAATPFMAASGAAGLADTAIRMGGRQAAKAAAGITASLAAGALTQAGTEKALRSLDTPEEYTQLAGVLAGIAGTSVGAVGSYLKNAAFRGMVKRVLQERLNTEYARSQGEARTAQEAANTGPAATPQVPGETAKPPAENIQDAEFEPVGPQKPTPVPEPVGDVFDAAAATPAAVSRADIKSGAEFDTPVGKAKVVSIKGGLVKYADSAGNENDLPVKRFLKLVSQVPTPQSSPSAAESSPFHASPRVSTPLQTPEVVPPVPQANIETPPEAKPEVAPEHVQALAEAAGIPEEEAAKVIEQTGPDHPGVQALAPTNPDKGPDNTPTNLPPSVTENPENVSHETPAPPENQALAVGKQEENPTEVAETPEEAYARKYDSIRQEVSKAAPDLTPADVEKVAGRIAAKRLGAKPAEIQAAPPKDVFDAVGEPEKPAEKAEAPVEKPEVKAPEPEPEKAAEPEKPAESKGDAIDRELDELRDSARLPGRTTPALGTPERDKLEADYKASDEARSAVHEKQNALEREVSESKYGSKKRELAQKKLDKLNEGDREKVAAHEALRKQAYLAMLEDAANQTENRTLRTAATYKLKEQRRSESNVRGSYKDETIARDGALAGIKSDLRRRVPEVDAADKHEATRQQLEALTPEENKNAIQFAINDVAQRFMEHPLTADKVDKTLSGALYAKRNEALKSNARAKVREIEKEWRDVSGTIAGGERNFAKALQTIEQSSYPADMQRGIDEAQKVLDDAKAVKASVEKKGKEDSGRFSDSFRPVAEMPAPTLREKGLWEGNIAEGGEFASDGRWLAKIEAIDDKKRREKMSVAPDTKKRSYDPATTKKIWDDGVKSATQPLTEVGTADYGGKDLAFYTGPKGIVALQAKLLRLAQSTVKSDEVRGSAPRAAVVLYRAGNPVAMIMPFRYDGPEIDVKAARKSATEPKRMGAEAGSAPMLTDLASGIAKATGMIPKDDPDAVYENYSGLTGAANVGLGAEETKFARNLGQTSRASIPTSRAAIRAASSNAQSAAIMRASVPLMKKALEGSEFTLPEVRLALVESRLRGLRDRWNRFAEEAKNLSDEEIPEAFDSHMLDLLKNIEGRKDIPQDVAQTATALFEAKAFDTLREFLSDTFADAGSRVATVMDQDWFDETTKDPHVKNAIEIYKRTVEGPMGENHAINEGVFSNALGPLDTYYPLIPLNEDGTSNVVGGHGKRRPYRGTKNQYNKFATGLAEHGYDVTPQAFRDRLSSAIRTNNKAAMIQTIKSVGLLRVMGPREQSDGTFPWRGQTFVASKPQEIGQARTLYKDGKVIHVPAQMAIMPEFLRREISTILEENYDPSTPTIMSKIMSLANTGSVKGPADFVFHMSNLLGTLIANTPFLSNSAGGKALSLPVIKKFYAIGRLMNLDPVSQASAEKLIRMSKMGLIPSRYASETFSKKFAEEMGAEKTSFSLTPFLYGPKGFDIRARLLMYDLATEMNPTAPDEEVRAFVNQLGNYVPELQGEIERAMKNSAIAPFFTAGSQMLRNGVNAFLGTSPSITPGGGGGGSWKSATGKAGTIAWKLMAGALGTTAAWMLVYHAMTGKWPHKDERAKLFQIPVQAGGSGWIDKYRHSKLGDQLWGKNNKIGYINFGFFNPIVSRGARALGIQNAFNEHAARGTPGQSLEAAGTEATQGLIQPFLGPIPRAAWVGITGKQPSLLSMRDRQGHVSPQFMPAIPEKTKPGLPSMGRRAVASVAQLNAFAENLGEATGMLNDEKGDNGNKWLRMLIDMFPLTTGAVSNSSNPYAHANALRAQRAGQR